MKCGDCGNTHPALPGFPNHVLCDYYHLHMSNLADASRCEHFKAKVISNADRIRAMTDEELAKAFYTGCENRAYNDNCLVTQELIERGVLTMSDEEQDKICLKCWLDWLKSPVEVDE